MVCRVKSLPQNVINSQISGLTVKGLITIVEVNDLTWTELPALPLTEPSDRNALGIQNSDTSDIKIQFDNSVSGYVGWTISGNDSEFFTDITPAVILYAKSESGTFNITVMEIA